MAKDTVEVLIEGGTATPGPPLGPALGPFGINMMQVVDEINSKTADFAGMKVPVKVNIDRDTIQLSYAGRLEVIILATAAATTLE